MLEFLGYCTRTVKMKVTLYVGMSKILDLAECDCETETIGVYWNFEDVRSH